MTESLSQRRLRLMGPNVPTFYDQPVEIVRGRGVELWDAEGNRYLDCYNNVPHVGHGHPRIVEAIARQSAELNTHTRYLHRGILDYLDRLIAATYRFRPSSPAPGPRPTMSPCAWHRRRPAAPA